MEHEGGSEVYAPSASAEQIALRTLRTRDVLDPESNVHCAPSNVTRIFLKLDGFSLHERNASGA